MNANIMAILNNTVAPKAGSGIGALRTKAASGQQTGDDIIALRKTADNCAVRDSKRVRGDKEPNFNDALRKKMDAEKPASNDDTPKKEKDVNPEKSDVSLQEAPASGAIHPEPEETGTVETGTGEPTESSDETQVKILNAASSGELDGNPQKTTVTPVPHDKTDASPGPVSATPETDEPSATGDKTPDRASRMLPPETPTDSAKPTQPVPAKNAEQTSSSAGNNDGKTSSNTESSVNTDKPVPPKQPDVSVKNDRFEAINNQRSSARNGVSQGVEKPAAPSQNASATTERQAKNTPQAPASSQKADVQTDTMTARTSVHKMNVATEQINSLGAEKTHHASENKALNDKLSVDKPLSEQTGTPSTSGETTSTGTESQKIPPAPTQGLAVGRQIQESISSSYQPGTQQMVIRLDPPDLGRVTIRFVEQPDGITGVLHVEKSQTRHEIQQALPEIIQNLQNADVNIKKIEVVLNNQPQYQSGDQSAGQNSNMGQQNAPGQHHTFANSSSYNEWLANANAGNTASGSHIELTDKSINMLI